MNTLVETVTATFSLDGEDVPFEPGETILQAARRARRYIPTCAGIRTSIRKGPAACAR